MLHKKKGMVAIMAFLFAVLPPGFTDHAKNNTVKAKESLAASVKSGDKHTDLPAFQYKKPSRSLEQNEISESNVSDNIYDRRIIVKTTKDMKEPPEKWNVEQVPNSLHMEKNHYMVVRVPKDQEYGETLRQIEQDDIVKRAEPNFTGDLSQKLQSSNAKHQWYMEKIGMKKAWEMTKGSSDTTIAVLDSGVNADHPAMKGRVLSGYNFVDDNKNTTDAIGHGTSVASIIAANTDQKRLAGIDAHANILPVKVSDDSGEVSTQNIVDGIYYAIEHDADIINMSYGAYKRSESEEEAIADAYDAGIILVASAGNDTSDRPSYPAAYPGVISVSSTGKDDKLSSFSNFGNDIDIAAPGEEIYSAGSQGDYVKVEGTSFSAPIVTGVSSLLQDKNSDWDPDQIAWALEDGAASSGKSEWNDKLGYGRINAYQSLASNLPDWSKDASDEKENAKELKLFQEETEKIQYPMDVDWYTFHVKEKGRVTIDVTTSTDTLDPVVALDSPSKDKERKFYDDGGKGENERFSFQAKKGDYHIAIYDYNQHWSNSDYTVQVNATKFRDVKQYEQEIAELERKGIIQGYPDGTFKPENEVNRLQTVRMILKEKEIDPDTYDAPNPHFTDIKPSDEGYPAIAAAADLDIIEGKENHTFDPYGYLTRSQMAAVMVGAFDLHGSTDEEFTDVPQTHWARKAINTLVANGIVEGYTDNTYKPMEKISRQHFSVLLYNYLQQKE